MRNPLDDLADLIFGEEVLDVTNPTTEAAKTLATAKKEKSNGPGKPPSVATIIKPSAIKPKPDDNTELTNPPTGDEGEKGS